MNRSQNYQHTDIPSAIREAYAMLSVEVSRSPEAPTHLSSREVPIHHRTDPQIAVLGRKESDFLAFSSGATAGVCGSINAGSASNAGGTARPTCSAGAEGVLKPADSDITNVPDNGSFGTGISSPSPLTGSNVPNVSDVGGSADSHSTFLDIPMSGQDPTHSDSNSVIDGASSSLNNVSTSTAGAGSGAGATFATGAIAATRATPSTGAAADARAVAATGGMSGQVVSHSAMSDSADAMSDSTDALSSNFLDKRVPYTPPSPSVSSNLDGPVIAEQSTQLAAQPPGDEQDPAMLPNADVIHKEAIDVGKFGVAVGGSSGGGDDDGSSSSSSSGDSDGFLGVNNDDDNGDSSNDGRDGPVEPGNETVAAAQPNHASSLLRDLTDEEADIVRNAVCGPGHPDDILATLDTDSVQRRSLHKLRPGIWLNDEVIHYNARKAGCRVGQKDARKKALSFLQQCFHFQVAR